MNVPPFRPGRILIVDDEQDLRDLLRDILSLKGWEPLLAQNGTEALASLRLGLPDLVLLDINMPGMSGMKVLREVRKIDRSMPIIMITAYGSIESAVEAISNGASDYITKPFENDKLVLTIRRALASCIPRQHRLLRVQLEGELPLRELLGSSVPMRSVLAAVSRVAPTDFTVVLTGETGAGKEMLARAIHRLSPRAAAPFIPVDCGAIQPSLIESELFGHERGAFTGADRTHPGKFEVAAGGTLFLDEVQSMPLHVQTRLLRALQERQVCRLGDTKFIDIDIRVIAATNQSLPSLVAKGSFRQDLFHRLNEFGILIPALRERPDDIPALARRFLDQTSAELKKDSPEISGPALDLLLHYGWPGNVRELRNVIRRAVLLADVCIGPENLGLQCDSNGNGNGTRDLDLGRIDGQCSLKEIVRRNVVRVEREVLFQTLKQTGGNKARAAKILHIDYKTIHTKTREYGLGTKGDGNHGQEQEELS